MPFFDHLEELRGRLGWSVAALIVGAIIGWFLVTRLDVLGILIEPIEPFLQGSKLKYLSPTEPFFITLKLALIVGFLAAFPVIAYHLWTFLSPALMAKERQVIVPSLYMGLVLFAIGVWFSYAIVLPMTLSFTMSFQTESLEQSIVIGEYMSVVVRLLLAFGAVFELPIVIVVLAALGLVTPQFLAAKRRHAIVGIAVLASVLTPGDVITVTLMMMLPLILLYEISIILSRVIVRRRNSPADVTEGV